MQLYIYLYVRTHVLTYVLTYLRTCLLACLLTYLLTSCLLTYAGSRELVRALSTNRSLLSLGMESNPMVSSATQHSRSSGAVGSHIAVMAHEWLT